MPTLKIYQIDAFTDKVFGGNPAAVCPLDDWLEDATLQAIAQENNLAETAFFTPIDDGYQIRWFTPKHEVPLCGHATLAAAYLILNELDTERQSVDFQSESGPLQVTRQDPFLTMDFPAYQMGSCQRPPGILMQGLSRPPEAVFWVEADPNYYAIYAGENDVRALIPELGLLEQLHPYGVVVTAPGNRTDCVSRYFAPSYGIPEDPVTGSIHCALVPYWAKQFNKTKIHAHQASQRGGDLYCEDKGDRVLIGGQAVRYLKGTITI